MTPKEFVKKVDEYVSLYNPTSGQYEHYDPKKLVDQIQESQKELARMVFGEAAQMAKNSLKQFSMSLGLSPNYGRRLPRDPFMTLMTETEYTVRPIDIRKGGWGR